MIDDIDIKNTPSLSEIRKKDNPVEQILGTGPDQESFFRLSLSNLNSKSEEDIILAIEKLDEFETEKNIVLPVEILIRVIEICNTITPAPEPGISLLGHSLALPVPYISLLTNAGLLDLAQNYFPSVYSMKILTNAALQDQSTAVQILLRNVLVQLPSLFSDPIFANGAIHLISALSYWPETFENDNYERNLIEALQYSYLLISPKGRSFFQSPQDLKDFVKTFSITLNNFIDNSKNFRETFIHENWLSNLLPFECDSNKYQVHLIDVCHSIADNGDNFQYLISDDLNLFTYSDYWMCSESNDVRAHILDLLTTLLLIELDQPTKFVAKKCMDQEYHQMAIYMSEKCPISLRRIIPCFISALMRSVPSSELFVILEEGGLNSIAVNSVTVNGERRLEILEGLQMIPTDLKNPQVCKACYCLCRNDDFLDWLQECARDEDEDIQDAAYLIRSLLSEYASEPFE